ncbi:MAG: hypothetical protein Q4D60_06170 [Eubacteriales bacterium]|nr:hypothetical protein [Eubacteriales bacterium]
MYRMKKALAITMSAAMMVPATAFAAGSPVKTSIAGKTAQYEADYTGKDRVLIISIDGKELKEGTDFTVVGEEPTNAGTHIVTIKGMGTYEGEAKVTLTIKKSAAPVYTINTKAVKALKKGVKAKKLKKKSVKVKLKVKTTGKKTFKVKGKKAQKWLKVTKNGVLKLKKGTPKGTYKVVVKIKGTDNFAGGKKVLKIKVK